MILKRGGYDRLGRSENVLAAVSLATKGELSDAFGPGSGPTAHVSPAYPLLLSVIFRTAGTGKAGELTKRLLAATLAAATYALFPFIALEAGLSVGVVVCAGAVASFLPLNFWPEVSGDHDAVPTGLMIALMFLCFARLWRVRTLTIRSSLLLGLVAGIGTLVAPFVVPLFACWTAVTLAAFRDHRQQYIRRMALAWLVLAACVAPWLARNMRTFGVPIWSRSNFWMEMNVSNNDLAPPTAEGNIAFRAAMHPFDNGVERDKYAAIGEIAYQAEQKARAKAWMRENPGRFAELTAMRTFFYWFPPMKSPWATLGMAILTVLGLSGLVLIFAERSRARWLFAILLAVFPLVYYVVQALARYRYPMEWSMKLLAGVAIWAIAARVLPIARDPRAVVERT
jgi:hypothetical protein